MSAPHEPPHDPSLSPARRAAAAPSAAAPSASAPSAAARNSASPSTDSFSTRFDGPAAETLSALLRDLARRQPGHEALVHPAFTFGGAGRRLSFAQLDARVDDLARGLIALGIGRGEHVAIWAASVPDWVPLMFALARVGAVLVTVNTALQHDEVAYVLRQSKAVAVLHTTRTGHNEASAILDALLAEASPAVARVRHRVWLPAAHDECPPQGMVPAASRGTLRGVEDLVVLGRLVPDGELAARERACAPGDVVNIQYTSGTTGFPKGVMLSHANVLHSGQRLGAELRTTADDRVALIVPLFHCFGCVVCVLGAWCFGATLCCIPQFQPGAALDLLEAERCTLVHGVPTMFSALLAHPDLPRRRLATLRAGLMAGAPCPPPLVRAVAERLPCAGISVTYGLTEASPGVAGSPPDAPAARRFETIGLPLPDVELRIADPATLQELPDGRPGELLVRGGNVMVGYHDEPEATARAITPDLWLRTGDQVVRGADGLLRIVGRIKDVIIRGGENIAPAEIEAVLREHPDIADAAVVGVPSEYFGEEIAAALILRDGARFDPEAYAALCTGRIACFKVPAVWKQVAAFPLTGSGKVKKYQLREQLRDEARSPSAPPAAAPRRPP
jgi:fatty-acyl-CoA synthase